MIHWSKFNHVQRPLYENPTGIQKQKHLHPFAIHDSIKAITVTSYPQPTLAEASLAVCSSFSKSAMRATADACLAARSSWCQLHGVWEIPRTVWNFDVYSWENHRMFQAMELITLKGEWARVYDGWCYMFLDWFYVGGWCRQTTRFIPVWQSLSWRSLWPMGFHIYFSLLVSRTQFVSGIFVGHSI